MSAGRPEAPHSPSRPLQKTLVVAGFVSLRVHLRKNEDLCIHYQEPRLSSLDVANLIKSQRHIAPAELRFQTK
jgi:hypothetical protein